MLNARGTRAGADAANGTARRESPVATRSVPRRMVRLVAKAALVYVAAAAAGNVAIWAGVGFARATGHEPEAIEQFAGIKHFRRVDDRVYAGGVADAGELGDLARFGVTLVVDLRSGRKGDPHDDPAAVRGAGMEFLSLPVVDGRAPDVETVRRFVAAVDRADGLVFVHCGGGVGRSTSMEAAYLSMRGERRSALDQLGVGPPTLEQIYSVWRARPGRPVARNAIVSALSRYVVDAPRQTLNWLESIV